MAKHVVVKLTRAEAEALWIGVNLGAETINQDGRDSLGIDGREEAAYFRAFHKLQAAMRVAK